MSRSEESVDGEPAPADRPGRRPPRWGLRTIGFLVLAFVAMIMSQVTGGYTVGQLGSLLFGLGGAGYCSVQGVRQARELGLRRLMDQGRAPGEEGPRFPWTTS